MRLAYGALPDRSHYGIRAVTGLSSSKTANRPAMRYNYHPNAGFGRSFCSRRQSIRCQVRCIGMAGVGTRRYWDDALGACNDVLFFYRMSVANI